MTTMELIDWLWNHREAILVAVGMIGVAAEGSALALLGLARLLEGLVRLTRTDADDRILAKIIAALESFAAWVPRLRQGARARPVDPRGTASLAAVLTIGVALAGCGGSAMSRARSALEYTSIAVQGSDDALDVTVVVPDSESCLERVRVGDLENWEAYDACMRRARTVARGVQAARATLMTTQASLDAIERSGDHSKSCRIVEPLAAVVPGLARTLSEAAVELPAQIATYSPLIASAIASACRRK